MYKHTQTWSVGGNGSRHARQLNHFHRSYLRRLLRIKRQDTVSNLRLLDVQDRLVFALKSKARWAGHIVRMSDGRLPKQPL